MRLFTLFGISWLGLQACAAGDEVHFPAGECVALSDCDPGELCSDDGWCVAPVHAQAVEFEPSAVPAASDGAPSLPDAAVPDAARAVPDAAPLPLDAGVARPDAAAPPPDAGGKEDKKDKKKKKKKKNDDDRDDD